MSYRAILPVLLVVSLSGCAAVQEHGGKVAGGVGAFVTASELELLEPQYLAGALVAWAIYDPLAPTWTVHATRLDEHRVRLDLKMRTLVTGGEGEAHRIFIRNARQIVEEGGFSDFEVVHYEEGISSTRPFARRVASGEIRLARSQTWPTL